MAVHPLGKFYEGFASMRRMLAKCGAENAPVVFANAIAEVAGYVDKGLEAAVAADELTDMAFSIGFSDVDAVQRMIAGEFERIAHIKGDGRGNGREEIADELAAPDIDLNRDYGEQQTNKPDNVVTLRVPVAAPATLPFIDMSRWDDEEPPPREWAVEDRYPLAAVSLFGGEGAIGKSILELQRAFAHTLSRDWLQTMPTPGPAIFIDTEDDTKELYRRARKIAAHYGTTIAAAIKGGLHLVSLVGDETVMATVGHNGKIEPTPVYHRLLQAAGDIKPVMISIASSANVYAGNESDRSQVQQFVTLLTRVAMVANAGLTLISHPSLAGINSDSGLSGSTQWHNAVRARAYLKGVKSENDDETGHDTGLREIAFKKNNYGPISNSLVLRFHDGLFLPVPGAGPFEQLARHAKAEEVFLTLLTRYTRDNRVISDKPSANYAPALFGREDEAKKAALNGTHLAAAMRELFRIGKIWNEQYGRPSAPRYRIMIKEPQ